MLINHLQRLRFFFSLLVFILIFFSSLCLYSQVTCHFRPVEGLDRRLATKYFSPYTGATFASTYSTIILGMSMPVNSEEIDKNRGSYAALSLFGLIQNFSWQFMACSSKGEISNKDDLVIENIDIDLYNSQRNKFWISHALNIVAISYMASISTKQDRWQRVQGAVLAPFIFDLLIQQIFYRHKFTVYENPFYVGLLNDPENKSVQLQTGLKWTF